MTQYLLSIYQPDGDPPPREFLEQVMRDVTAVRQEMKAAGAWVLAGGLYPARQAAVVRTRGGGVHVTDGPFAEAKEHVGGFCVIRAASRDDATKWAGKLARATTLPIEVRAFQEERTA